ncbi:hypothetical protein HYX06_04220 [Candidatus Woesearchaeota archaeon]|nr:hypothetical protein [Candidatus Woesearchaeota archaeon]
MYQVRSIEQEGSHGPDGFSEHPAVYVNLISTAGNATRSISASLGEDGYATIREIYHRLAEVYGVAPKQIAKIVRFKQDLRREDGVWKAAHRIEVEGNGQTHNIEIKPHDLESAIQSMVDAFNRAMLQSRKPAH